MRCMTSRRMAAKKTTWFLVSWDLVTMSAISNLLLTACSVKMAGYWQSYFFACLAELEVHKDAKKRTGPISNPLDRTSLVNNGFVIWDKTPKNDH